MKNKLEDAAREYAEIRGNIDKETQSYIEYNSFKDGAQWQLNNMWIPVEGELPEDDEDLFFGLDMNRNPPAVGACIYDKKMNIWYDEKIEITHITHWMPIPEFKKG